LTSFLECAQADEKRKEDAQIVTMQEFDPYFGDTCEFCEKTIEEESQE